MNLKSLFLALAVAVPSATALAGAADDIKLIDKAFADKLEMTAENAARVRDIRDQAAQLLKAGKESEAAALLREAVKIVKTAKDAALMNASDG